MTTKAPSAVHRFEAYIQKTLQQKYLQLRKLYANLKLRIGYVPTEYNHADLMTKPVRVPLPVHPKLAQVQPRPHRVVRFREEEPDLDKNIHLFIPIRTCGGVLQSVAKNLVRDEKQDPLASSESEYLPPTVVRNEDTKPSNHVPHSRNRRV